MLDNLLFSLENSHGSSWNQENSKIMPLDIDSFSNEEFDEYKENLETLSNTKKEINILSFEDNANFIFNQKIYKFDIEKNKEDELSSLSLNNSKNNNNILEDNFNFSFIQNKQPQFNNSIANKKEELEIINPKSLFQINRTKRGRKEIGISDKIHSNSAFDNLQTKIQVNFISFIIKISNDALISEFGKNTPYKFKDINYKLVFIRYQKLIDLYKPKKDSEDNLSIIGKALVYQKGYKINEKLIRPAMVQVKD